MASVTVPKHIRRRRRLKAAGLCFWCGKSKADRGWRKRCSSCLEKHRSYPSAGYTDKKKEDRQKRAQSGLCVYCGKHPATEGKRCLVCKERDNAKHREWLKKTAADRIAKGLCKDCGKNPLSSKMCCVGCLDKRLIQISTISDEKKKLRNERLRRWYLKMRLIVIDHYTHGKRECACCGEKMLMFGNDILDSSRFTPCN